MAAVTDQELLISNRGGIITLKLRVPALPAEHTIVQGTAPCGAGISCVQHFPGLGFLPAPTVRRYYRGTSEVC